MNEALFAVIQGIVEGLTEFLPVSSTGHLILTGYLLRHTGESAKTFEIFIQLGAILAVAFLYRRRLFDLLRRWSIRSAGAPRLTAWHIVIAMLPVVIVGLAGRTAIKTYLFSPWTVLVGLTVGAAYLIAADLVRSAREKQGRIRAAILDEVSYAQALGIGLFQCLSLWPGFSRAGATIGGAVMLGVGYRPAAEFSFVLAVPVMIAATGLDLVKSLHLLGRQDVAPFAIGFIVSFLVAWAAVVGFLRILQRWKLSPFAIYRFVLAALFALFLLRHGGQ